MRNCVDVRISNVEQSEIATLNALINSLDGVQEERERFVAADREHNYVVTVTTGELPELKHALRLVLQVVEPDRIEIEPWDGTVH